MTRRLTPAGRASALAALAAVAACAVALGWPAASGAQTRNVVAVSSTYGANRATAVTVEVDQTQVLATPGAGATVFIANPDIADVQTPDSRHVMILGRRPGQTTAFVFTHGDAYTKYAITVRRSESAVVDALRAQVPGATIDVFRGPAGMTIAGRVKSPQQAAALKAAAQQYLADKEALNFAVEVEGSVQVNLQVRVAQVSRSVTNTLSFNWNAIFNNGSVAVGLLTGRAPSTGLGGFIRDPSASQQGSLGFGYQNGSVNLTALIDALQSNGLVTILAEPNLTAASGVTASFLAGGEFPVPISQGLNQISIDWKKFGVSIDFTPTVLDDNRISVRVRPEVSELSTVGAVTINSVQIPSVAVRRADTTVELASGQSFAIAGMFQNNMSKTISQFPGLGSLPILGQMFRSSSFSRNESELVIIVTPYIVRPVDRPGDLRLPTESITYATDLEEILLGGGQNPDQPAAPQPGRPRLTGPAGFMLEDRP